MPPSPENSALRNRARSPRSNSKTGAGMNFSGDFTFSLRDTGHRARHATERRHGAREALAEDRIPAGIAWRVAGGVALPIREEEPQQVDLALAHAPAPEDCHAPRNPDASARAQVAKGPPAGEGQERVVGRRANRPARSRHQLVNG